MADEMVEKLGRVGQKAKKVSICLKQRVLAFYVEVSPNANHVSVSCRDGMIMIQKSVKVASHCHPLKCRY